MTEQISNSIQQPSFKDFNWGNSRNRLILQLAGVAFIIQLAIFKYFYPYASFIHADSFVYIESAYHNLDVNTYMIGYSKFLRLISILTKSDTIIVFIQYLLIQGSSIFFLLTIFYFYKPRFSLQLCLVCFMIFNPLFLYLANLISSDGLFLSLSMIWVTLLLWLLNRPSVKLIVIHALVLYLTFTVRYNALIYPFISIGVFIITRQSLYNKVLGIVLGSLLCGLFVVFTGYKYKKLTGYWQYSPFAGWQMANNGMYAYRYVDRNDRKPVPEKFKVLDNMVRQYFDSTRDTKKYPIEAIMASTFYMWSPGLPLFKYRDLQFKTDTTSSELKRWASMGPLYREYGAFLIKQYPSYYMRYFLWPNTNKYYAPPIEFLEEYNSGKNFVTAETKEWFAYKSQKVMTRFKDSKISILNFYSIMSGMVNILMLCTLASFILLKGWRDNRAFGKGILLGGSIWLFNAIFTVCASSAALRFQAFPILLTTSIALLLLDQIISRAKVAANIDKGLEAASSQSTPGKAIA